MIARHGEIKIEWDDEFADVAILASRVVFQIDTAWMKSTVTVKAGFASDGDAAPWIMKKTIGHPWTTPWSDAAVLRWAMVDGELAPIAICESVFGEHLKQFVKGVVFRKSLELCFGAAGKLAWSSHTTESVVEARRHLEVVPSVTKTT